eukprot:Sspe_Gene.118848::Locus_113288_Transcript_1_1_Confidence_1.000_Length_2183::g.118848::m.118848
MIPLLLLLGALGAAAACDYSADVVVWGGTVCGATAAVGSVRADPEATVVWVVNGTRLGGMTSGGLGGIDLAMDIGGLASELLSPLGRNFEPHVAEAAVERLLKTGGSRVTVLRNALGVAAVETAGSQPRSISSIRTVSGYEVCGKVFVDCSYEGDLVFLSGTDYAVGREAPGDYYETMAGTDTASFAAPGEKPSFFNDDVSPFVNGSEGTLLPTIVGVFNFTANRSDDLVMSYCFRMCLTNNATNRIPVAPPDGYTPAHLELLRRQIASETRRGMAVTMDSLFLIRHLPNMKIDLNSGQWNATGHPGGFAPFSTDFPFLQKGWATASPSERRKIFDEHVWWTRALLYYLSNDPDLAALQPALVKEMATWGLCADEYTEHGNWSPQLYVREAIRLRGKRVMTEMDTFGSPAGPSVATSVGLSSWAVDIHAVQRVAAQINGKWQVVNAGGRDIGRIHNEPGKRQLSEIPYEALVPKDNDTSNLIVAVCASFTHVAFATYRLEPQYAIFGHSAGVAAVHAVREGTAVQNINVTKLQTVLATWSPPQLLRAAAPRPTVSIAKCNGDGQKWEVRGTTVRLVSNTSLCLSVSDYSVKDGAEVWLSPCHTSDPDPAHQNQEFKVLDKHPYVQFQNVHSGLCLAPLQWMMVQTDCSSPAATWNHSGGLLQTTSWGLCATAPSYLVSSSSL